MVHEIKAAGLYRQTAQVFAVLLPVQSVGVMGDARTYDDVIAVRAVEHRRFHDGRLGPPALRRCWPRSRRGSSTRCQGVNRVVYDISSKPPATIEWE